MPKPFWDRVVKTDDGCWIFTGHISWSGYGIAYWRGHTTTAQRRAYLELVGPIPEGLHLDHLCGVRRCVNPAHLEPVTRLENNRRSGGGNRGKQFCIRGHPLFGDNLYQRANGKRECRICKRQQLRDWTAAHRAA